MAIGATEKNYAEPCLCGETSEPPPSIRSSNRIQHNTIQTVFQGPKQCHTNTPARARTSLRMSVHSIRGSDAMRNGSLSPTNYLSITQPTKQPILYSPSNLSDNSLNLFFPLNQPVHQPILLSQSTNSPTCYFLLTNQPLTQNPTDTLPPVSTSPRPPSPDPSRPPNPPTAMASSPPPRPRSPTAPAARSASARTRTMPTTRPKPSRA